MKSYRVLLLAMSGVRVKNDELRELGMSLPGFIERGEVIASRPSLGLLTLAAHTPVHWETEYREIDELSVDAVDQIVGGDYDLVAISSLTARILDAYRIADVLRKEPRLLSAACTPARCRTKRPTTRMPSYRARVSCCGPNFSRISKRGDCGGSIRLSAVDAGSV